MPLAQRGDKSRQRECSRYSVCASMFTKCILLVKATRQPKTVSIPFDLLDDEAQWVMHTMLEYSLHCILVICLRTVVLL